MGTWMYRSTYSLLVGVEWSASFSALLTPRDRVTGTYGAYSHHHIVTEVCLVAYNFILDYSPEAHLKTGTKINFVPLNM
jgi:hypothetical protein